MCVCMYTVLISQQQLCTRSTYSHTSFVPCFKNRTFYNVIHVFVQVEAAKRFVFHFIQAAEHQTVYAEIDHTKKGPIPAPPVELFEVQYTSVRGAGQQELATLAHFCECGTATTCKCA